MGRGLARKQPEPIGRRVTGQWRVRVQQRAVESNDPHGGQGRVCEGDRARVGVSHGMVEVKLQCFRWLSPFLNTLRTGSFKWFKRPLPGFLTNFNPLNAELNPICYLLALLAHHFLHVSSIKVESLTLRLLMSYIYIYMERLLLMILDHTQRRSTVGRTPLDA